MDLSDHYPDVHKQFCLLQILILLSHKLHLGSTYNFIVMKKFSNLHVHNSQLERIDVYA